MGTTAIDTLKNVTQMLASNVHSPVVLIYEEENNFKLDQMGNANFTPDVIRAVLDLLNKATGNNTVNSTDNIEPTRLDEEDDSDVSDQYDDIAKIIDAYDDEQELPGGKSEQVKDMLGLLINDTAAFLEEFWGSDSEEAVELGHGMDLDATEDLSQHLVNLHLGSSSPSSAVVVKEEDLSISQEPTPVVSKMKHPSTSVIVKEEDQTKSAQVVSELITTPVLKTHGLVFNTRYGLIICQSCSVGLPLICVSGHLSDRNVTTWDDNEEKFLKFTAKHPFLVGVSTAHQKEVFRRSLVKDLIDTGVVKSEADILDGNSQTSWRQNGDRIRTNGDAVEGLRTHIGYTCKKCVVAGRARAFMVNHSHKGGEYDGIKSKTSDYIKGVAVQTFSEIYRLMYPVFSHSLPSETVSVSTELSPLELLENEHARILQTVPDTLKFAPDLRSLPPIFRDGGIEHWLARFDRRQLSALLPNIPHAGLEKKSSLFSRLRTAVFKLFAEDLQLLQDGEVTPEIPHILTNGSRHNDRRRFSILTQPGSIKSYATVEFHLMWTLLEYSEQLSPTQGNNNTSSPLFILSDTHRDLLRNLRKALKSRNQNTVSDSLRIVLDSLYFPTKEERDRSYRKPVHEFPILQFIIFTFITPDGSYHPIHLMPPALARHQYCMRLRGFHKINQAIEKEKRKDWRSVALDFVDTFLDSFGDSPFSIIRFWMHGLSVLARNTPRPNLIWWKGDTMLMSGNEISFVEYRQKTYIQVLQLEHFILNEVMFGFYTMEEAENVFNLKNLEESGDETTLGHGVIADTSTPLMRTAQSDIFFERLFVEKKLGILPSGQGGIIVDPLKGVSWLAAIHTAFGMLVAACHILIITGRGTEWESIGPTNNVDGPKGVVYDPEAQTGAFNARSHKGLNIQGVYKHNRRYMPYEIFRLLYLLLRVVRPFELMVLFSTIIPDTEKPSTIQAYNKHIFASLGKAWTSADISRSLQDWFHHILGLRVGLHDYRHMVIAIQRKYMDLQIKQPSEMEMTLNALRGHQKAVGDAHYARETHLGSCSPEERERALSLAREYHRTMGFSTGFNDVLTSEAKKLRAEFSYQPPVASDAIHPLTKKLKGAKQKQVVLQDDIVLPSIPPAKRNQGKSKEEVQNEATIVQVRRSARPRKPTQRYDNGYSFLDEEEV